MKKDGFSLVEVLIAMVIMAAALVALAQLGVIATRTTVNARTATTATLLAEQKLEQLRGLAYGFDAAGLAITDAGLSASPAVALTANTAGCVDYLDEAGIVVAAGTPTMPSGASYTRRWSIAPLPSDPSNTLVLQVLVTRYRDRGAADTSPGGKRLPDEARLVSVTTRRAR